MANTYLAEKSDIPVNLSQLAEDADHRTVTDVEKNAWNDKQPKGDYATSDSVNQLNKLVQDLDSDKQDVFRYATEKDSITQLIATEIIADYGNYDGKVIEFITNGDMPNKVFATGRVMSDASGNQFLLVHNNDGTLTQWNKSYKEKHNFECRNLINEPITELDSLTIDIQGDAPYVATVRAAKNKPSGSGEKGVIIVIAYALNNQIQIYQDIETGRIWHRTINGSPDKHSFGVWVDPYEPKMTSVSGNAAQLKPNVFTTFTAPVDNLDITVEQSDGYSEYSFQFTSGSGGCNLSIPVEFKWSGGKAPELKPNIVYQVVLFNGTAYISGGVAV